MVWGYCTYYYFKSITLSHTHFRRIIMAVNFDRLKEQQQVIDARNARGGSSVKYFTPKQGMNRVRLLPPWLEDNVQCEDVYKEVSMHFGVGPNGMSFVCSCQGCPICEFVERLRNSGDPSDLETSEIIKAKVRYSSNIIDLDDPIYTEKDVQEYRSKMKDPTKEVPFAVGDSKIQLFSYGSDVCGKLLRLFNALKLDISDLDHGYNVIIDRSGTGRNTKYNSVMIHPEQKGCVLSKKGKDLSTSEALKVIPNLSLILIPKSMEDMVAAINGTTVGSLSSNSSASKPVLPPPVRAPALPAIVAKPAAAKPVSVTPVAGTSVIAAPAEDDTPSCFKDVEIWSDKDPECVGGKVGNEDFDKCPFWQVCGESVGKLQQVRKGRRSATKPVVAEVSNEAGELEAELAAAIKK